MKKILSLICISVLVFTSCSNDDDRIDFDTIGSTFEVDGINFNSSDNVSSTVNITIPNQIEVFEADVPLVYIVDPIATASNGGIEVWEPLPRTFFFNDGGFAQFRYNFIFDAPSGIFDLDIILETDDFTALDGNFTQNQIFRIVIVPSAFALNNDTSDLNKVMTTLKLDTTDILEFKN